MQVGTEIYVNNIREGVDWIKKHNKVTVVIESPKWQIDFDRYGGRVAYETCKHFYWKRFDMGYKNNDGLSPDVHKLMEQFIKDLHVKLDIPKKYDIYR